MSASACSKPSERLNGSNPVRQFPLPQWEQKIDIERIREEIDRLTPREFAVLSWIAMGKQNSEIAVILGLSQKIIKRDVENILCVLTVENRCAAASIFHIWNPDGK
jgi:DNA-binding NarL/FixJ family response regulator